MALLNAVIDLSHHNVVTSFQQIRESGIIGIIHKATQGTQFTDGEFHQRRNDALRAGLLFGSYHFGTKGDPEQQADYYLDNVESTELMVLDFEPNGIEGTMSLAEAETFVSRIKAKTGRYPGIYSGEAFINEQLAGNTSTVLKDCFLWIAKYSESKPIVPPAFSFFTLWQYTDGSAGPQPHRVPGVGRCDRNKFNGDETALKDLFLHPASPTS